MAVHITKIYTRTGDDGTTVLSNFDRVPKYDSRLEAYADCEEANAMIGQVLALGEPSEKTAGILRRVQNELFDCGADLATPVEENPKYPPLRVEASYIERMEQEIDELNENVPNLDSFILPGGSPTVALIHSARIITRRAERCAWRAIDENPDTTNVLTAKYLNRLSDLLFVIGRVEADGDDVKWVPGASR